MREIVHKFLQKKKHNNKKCLQKIANGLEKMQSVVDVRARSPVRCARTFGGRVAVLL